MSKKTCSRCKKNRQLSAFGKNAGNPDGLQWWCRTCVADHARKRREDRKASRSGLLVVAEPEPPRKAPARSSADVEAVVAHYRFLHPNSNPGARERSLIAARLKEGYTVDQLTAAIDGQHRSPFHLGENDGGKKYLTLEMAVRSSSKVDQFLAVPERPKSGTKTGRQGSAIDEFVRRHG